ncbi:hypothetical protein KR200_005000, partial [Drosophila serrata]
DHVRGVLVTAPPAAVQTSSLLLPIDEPSNTHSLAYSVNSVKDKSLDDQHSDESGISASSQSNNNLQDKQQQPLKLTVVSRPEQRYIGPNCYNMTPEPPQQEFITRIIFIPQLSGLPYQGRDAANRQFAFGGASSKGVMQRFMASHGKVGNISSSGRNQNGVSSNSSTLKLNTRTANSNTLKLNTHTALALLENGNSPTGITTVTMSPAAIERDSDGRPLRQGYVPVEQKIQQELQDLKSREKELKRVRKINRQNTLKVSLDKLTYDEADGDDDDNEDSEVDHCYGPGKLRTAQSTQKLDRNVNEPEDVHKPAGICSLSAAAYIANGARNGSTKGMRLAMSLPQLCDLSSKQTPLSRGPIAQWESVIK